MEYHLTVMKSIFHCSFPQSQSENKEKYNIFFPKARKHLHEKQPPQKKESTFFPLSILLFFLANLTFVHWDCCVSSEREHISSPRIFSEMS